MSGRLLTHSRESFRAERAEQQQQCRQCLMRMANLGESVRVAQASRDTAAAAGGGSDGGSAAGAAAAEYEEQLGSLVAQLVNEFESLQRLQASMQRLTLVEALVAGPGAAQWEGQLESLRSRQAQRQVAAQQRSGGQAPPPPQHLMHAELWRSAFRAAPRELQHDLEVSFVDHVSAGQLSAAA